jgi:hypothetical protein
MLLSWNKTTSWTTFEVFTKMQNITNHLAHLTYSWTALSEDVNQAGHLDTTQGCCPLHETVAWANLCGKRRRLLNLRGKLSELNPRKLLLQTAVHDLRKSPCVQKLLITSI